MSVIREPPSFCFGILNQTNRVEYAWACCDCKAITTSSVSHVCIKCGHARCEAPSLEVYAACYRSAERREAYDVE